MDARKPYAVGNKKVNLVVMDATDGLPAAFALMGTRAKKKIALRVTGGCKGMSTSDKEEMMEFFSQAFTGYQGLIWSGGTRQVVDGVVDPMVTDVPGVVAAVNEGCVALGTVPRTSMLSLQEDSRLVLDDWGTVPNPDMSGILIVQNGPDGKMDWDGDLDAYFALMQNWQTYADFETLGLCSWNGGDITEDEIMRAIKLKWPVMLIGGSGRVTDEIIHKFVSQDPEFRSQIPENHGTIYVGDRNDPAAFKDILQKEGFII